MRKPYTGSLSFQDAVLHGLIIKQPNLLIQFRYAPDTDAILILIQTNLLIHFRYTSDMDAILILILSTYKITIQQAFFNGIFKPISNNYPLSLQMESLSPFPK